MKQSRAFVLDELATRTDLTWAPFRPGVERHDLYDCGPEGPASALLRYAPGATVPAHQHAGFEHIYVIAGAQEDENGRYEAGTMVINPPGTRHFVRSPEGCLVLVVWLKPVRFV